MNPSRQDQISQVPATQPTLWRKREVSRESRRGEVDGDVRLGTLDSSAVGSTLGGTGAALLEVRLMVETMGDDHDS